MDCFTNMRTYERGNKFKEKYRKKMSLVFEVNSKWDLDGWKERRINSNFRGEEQS